MSLEESTEEKRVDMTIHEDEVHWSQQKKKRGEEMAPKSTFQKLKKKDEDDGEVGCGKNKTRKKKENPNALTCAFSNFISFQLLEERKKMKADPSRALQTFAKFGKSVGEKWRSMTSSEKALYEGDGEDGCGKKKRKKKEKDPSAPKRALSAFMRFQIEERKRMKVDASQAPLTFTEVGKFLGEKWKNMSSFEKEPYEAAAKVDQEHYKKAVTEYKSGQAGSAESIESETHFDDE